MGLEEFSLDQLMRIYKEYISPRRMSRIQGKYDLLKILWKQQIVEDKYLRILILNCDISQYDDAFTRYLLSKENYDQYLGENQYGKFPSSNSNI